uniref:Peptidase_M13 domain-containing protein n=1 Tax=Panagrellus redivivus TaxID=6233 RepID=A0A7E4ZYE0_PANRE
NIAYFKKLHALFTSKRDFANYAISSRSIICTELLTSVLLVKPVAQMYVTKYKNREVIVPKLTKMVTAIIEVLADMLNNAEWLDYDTRKNALNKLNHMEYSFVYPENLFDDTLLIEKDIPPSEPSESFIALFTRLMRNKVTASCARINQPVDKTEWIQPILTSNGFYVTTQNKFHIAIGILESPHFNQNVPDYVTYATLGVISGHEIMHGFDDDGRLYDAAGNKRNWWKTETAEKYVKKTSCYVDQYTKEGVDGQLSLGENIGDNVGMELAYKAYKKVMGNATEPALPGFEHFTVDQMFFLSYANAWCTSLKKEEADPNDPHPYALTRVKMTSTNIEEFSEAFKCPKKSTMNPDDRCSIW